MFEMVGVSFGATLAGCFFLVGTAGAAMYFFMRRKHDEERHRQEEERRLLSFEQMQTIVTEEIKNVRELVTVRKTFTAEISFADDKKIPYLDFHMPGSDRKFQMSYSGTITCGCDLDAIRFERGELSDCVKIIVPPSRILDMYADINSFKIHHQSAGILADDLKLEHQKDLVVEDLEAQKNRAVHEGILEQADESVRQMLTAIISRRGLNQNFEFEIIFRGNSNTRVLNSSQQNLLR
ncbi:MAG: DUF4230 domain-containing protein [Selenomonadaceae bacterium]|nr:DUF4230 domain-containing protein [Selenomonadaceae bacterium]